jgi:hypothetical protein
MWVECVDCVLIVKRKYLYIRVSILYIVIKYSQGLPIGLILLVLCSHIKSWTLPAYAALALANLLSNVGHKI